MTNIEPSFKECTLSKLAKIQYYIRYDIWTKYGLIQLILLPISCIYTILYLISFYVFSSDLLHKIISIISGVKNKQFTISTAVNYNRKNNLNARIPIICVGNIVIGGSGKTPLSILCARLCLKYKLRPAFLGHGYKAKSLSAHDVLKVQTQHTVDMIGDEALLLSKVAPTYIAKRRMLGIKAIDDTLCYDCIIMDDGMQDHSIQYELLVLVIDANYMFGNNLILPAGPLRECTAWGLRRADSFVFVGQDYEQARSACKCIIQKFPKLAEKILLNTALAYLKVTNISTIAGRRFIVIVGIADPKRFLRTAMMHGAIIVESFVFPDHHYYTAAELKHIYYKATTIGCAVLTTSKDFVKIDSRYYYNTVTLEIVVQLDNEHIIIDKILKLGPA